MFIINVVVFYDYIERNQKIRAICRIDIEDFCHDVIGGVTDLDL